MSEARSTPPNGSTLVVLGVADSPSGRAALNVAADIAVQGRHGLSLVKVWDRTPEAEVEIEKQVFARLCAEARFRAHGVEVAAQLVPGDLGPSLVERSAGAALLVIGAGTPGAESAASRWLVQNARCPIIVVDAAEHIIDYRAGPRPADHNGADHNGAASRTAPGKEN